MTKHNVIHDVQGIATLIAVLVHECIADGSLVDATIARNADGRERLDTSDRLGHPGPSSPI